MNPEKPGQGDKQLMRGSQGSNESTMDDGKKQFTRHLLSRPPESLSSDPQQRGTNLPSEIQHSTGLTGKLFKLEVAPGDTSQYHHSQRSQTEQVVTHWIKGVDKSDTTSTGMKRSFEQMMSSDRATVPAQDLLKVHVEALNKIYKAEKKQLIDRKDEISARNLLLKGKEVLIVLHKEKRILDTNIGKKYDTIIKSEIEQEVIKEYEDFNNLHERWEQNMETLNNIVNEAKGVLEIFISALEEFDNATRSFNVAQEEIKKMDPFTDGDIMTNLAKKSRERVDNAKKVNNEYGIKKEQYNDYKRNEQEANLLLERVGIKIEVAKGQKQRVSDHLKSVLQLTSLEVTGEVPSSSQTDSSISFREEVIMSVHGKPTQYHIYVGPTDDSRFRNLPEGLALTHKTKGVTLFLPKLSFPHQGTNQLLKIIKLYDNSIDGSNIDGSDKTQRALETIRGIISFHAHKLQETKTVNRRHLSNWNATYHKSSRVKNLEQRLVNPAEMALEPPVISQEGVPTDSETQKKIISMHNKWDKRPSFPALKAQEGIITTIKSLLEAIPRYQHNFPEHSNERVLLSTISRAISMQQNEEEREESTVWLEDMRDQHLNGKLHEVYTHPGLQKVIETLVQTLEDANIIKPRRGFKAQESQQPKAQEDIITAINSLLHAIPRYQRDFPERSNERVLLSEISHAISMQQNEEEREESTVWLEDMRDQHLNGKLHEVYTHPGLQKVIGTLVQTLEDANIIKPR